MKRTIITTKNEYVYLALKKLMSYKSVTVSSKVNWNTFEKTLRKLKSSGNNIVYDKKEQSIKLLDNYANFEVFKLK